MNYYVVMFDFGNVLGLIDYEPMWERLSGLLGVEAAGLKRLAELKAAGDLGRAFERGLLGPEEFAERVLALGGFRLPFADFQAAWPDIFTLNEPVARLARELKRAGHVLLLGSNTNVLHADYYRRKFQDALSVFDHFIFSYEVGVMKPEPGFFAACLRAAGAAAEACLFIDDAEANVEGARRAGLTGVLYRDPEGLVAELRRLGVEVAAGQP